jgi:hypothetical protein
MTGYRHYYVSIVRGKDGHKMNLPVIAYSHEMALIFVDGH